MTPLRYTSAQVQRTPRHLIHCVACCRNCNWLDDHYMTAARAATRHVRETGHEVGVDQGTVYTVSVKARP